jgi:hypothetical protein
MLASLLPHVAERQPHLMDISPLSSSAPSSAPSPHTPGAASACSPGSSRNSGSKVKLSAAQRSAIAKLVLSRLVSASPSTPPVEQLAAVSRPPSPPRTTRVRAAFFTQRHEGQPPMSHGVFASHMFRADASPLKRSHDALEEDDSERFTELPAAPAPRFQPFLHHVERRDSEHISPLAASTSSQMPSAVAVSTPPVAAAPRQHAPATWAHFYASEAAWAEGALAEARRISGERDEAAAARPSDAYMSNVAAFAQPSLQQRRQTDMPMSYAKRLRTEEAAPPRRNTDGPCMADGNASPGLVGVLSNFRDMLKSREAGCRGLEELAREAGRMGELDLLRTPPSQEHVKRDMSDEEVD